MFLERDKCKKKVTQMHKKLPTYSESQFVGDPSYGQVDLQRYIEKSQSLPDVHLTECSRLGSEIKEQTHSHSELSWAFCLF